MIETSGISKRFKNGKGIFDLSFRVNEGEVFGFIGPNGAGKSTTIRHLMGFLRPDRGTARIGDCDCWSESEKIGDRIGYLPGEIVFPAGLAARDFLDLQAVIHRGKGKTREKALLDRFSLNIDVPVKNMSKGMKQKLAIVAAFMGDPDVIILDEPGTGLDPLMQKELIDLLAEEKKRGKTIFLSSHIFEEIETVSDVICIIKDGRIIKHQTIDAIFGELKKYLVVRLRNDSHLPAPWERMAQESGDPEALKCNPEALRRSPEGCLSYRIPLDDSNVNEIIRELAEHDICALTVEQKRLRDVFEAYYQGGDGDGV